MGSCSSAEPPTIFEVLDTKLACDTEVQNFDDQMIKAEQVINEIEEVRSQISQAWGRLLCQSGAIVLKFPKVYSALLGILFQVSRDLGHEIGKFISLKKEKPFVEEVNSQSESVVHATVECFHVFVSTVDNFKDRVDNMKERIEIIDTKVEESKDSTIDAFKEKAGTLEEMRPLLEKLHSNRRKIKFTSKVISEISKLISSIPLDSESLINKLGSREERQKLDSLFQKIYDQTSKAKDKEQRTKSNTILFSRFSEEEIINWDDVKRIWYLVIGEDYKEMGPLPPPKKEEHSKSHSSKRLDRRDTERQGFFSKKKDVKKAEETIKKLNEQIEELKTQLEEMKTQQQTVKTEVSMAKPIFIHSMKPFKNWNIQLGSSFSSSSTPTTFAIDYEAEILLIGTESGEIELVSMNTWEIKAKLKAKSRVNHAISVCDSSNFIVVDSERGISTINHISEEISELGQLALPATSVAYSFDGDLLYFTCEKTLVIYSIINTCELTQRSHYFEGLTLTKAVYFKECKLLVIGSQEGFILLFDTINNQVVFSYKEHEGQVLDIIFIKFKGIPALASTASDKTILIFSLNEKQVIKKLQIPNSKTDRPANHLLYGYDEKTIFTTHDDGKLILNNYNTGSEANEHVCKQTSTSDEKITAVLYAGDRSSVIVGSSDGKVDVYQTV